jgi:ATP-dependent helicase Lhr and Lhr-like helicase
VGALYIGPLKALINDQFIRLNDLCTEAGIRVTAWHGDIGAGKKQALLKRPAGILQITPEALEGLLLNRAPELMGVFGDLRWVVIDEVHAFMGSDRGGQVLALLDRLARFAVRKDQLPRRIGLSATLGDYDEAKAWLDGGTQRGVELISTPAGGSAYLLLDHFMVRPKDEADTASSKAGAQDRSEPEGDSARADRLIAQQTDVFEAAYSAVQERKKVLIFTNRRGDAEEMITGLRRLAERRGAPDIYHVHHGSIAAALREAAEAAMRDSPDPACTAATITLELGIDLGELDRVLQLGPTHSVASFLQRLGRAGRRGQRREMFFLLREEEHQSSASVLERIPWELLQAIAVIQLYAEEHWIEPIARPTCPGSLLYQQTMSIVGAAGELTPPQLASRVLTLAPFCQLAQDQFRTLLQHLLEIDHLEKTEEGGLILGLAGEKVVRNFRFLATFKDAIEWTVRDGSREIGTIGDAVPVGERFALAGRTWEVVDLVAEQRLIVARLVKGSVRTIFLGGGAGDIHDRVVERMRQVLVEASSYPYLTERAQRRIDEARQLAQATRVASGPGLVPLGGDQLGLIPWCGTRKLETIALKLKDRTAIKALRPERFYIVVTAGNGLDGLASALNSLAAKPWEGAEMVATLDRLYCERAKYDEFLPESLLKEGFMADHLDVAGAERRFREVLEGAGSSATAS